MEVVRTSRPPSFSERPRPAPLICASVDYCEPEASVERSITQEKEEIEYHSNALLSSSLPFPEIQELLRLINKIALNNSFYNNSPMSSLHSPKASYSNNNQSPNPLHLILPLIEPNAGGETISTTARVVIDLFQHSGDVLCEELKMTVQDIEFVILFFDLANRYSFVQLDELFVNFTKQVSPQTVRQAKLILVGKTHHDHSPPAQIVSRDEIDAWCKMRQNIMSNIVFLEYSSLYAQGVRDLLSLIVESFQAQLNAHHTKLAAIKKRKQESPIQANSLQFFNKTADTGEESAEAEAKRLHEGKIRDQRAKKVYDIEQAMQETLLADWQESETLAAQYELQLLQSRSEDTPPQQQLRSGSSLYRLASSNLSLLIDSNNTNNNGHVSVSSPKKDLASMVEAMHAPRDEHALYLAGMHTHTSTRMAVDEFESEDDLFALDDDDLLDDQDAHWKLSTVTTGSIAAAGDKQQAADSYQHHSAALIMQQHNQYHQSLEHQSSSDSAFYDQPDSHSSTHKNQLLLAAASTSIEHINCGNDISRTELDDLPAAGGGGAAVVVGGERRTSRRWYNFFSCSS